MKVMELDGRMVLDPSPFNADSLRRIPKYKLRCRRYDEGLTPEGYIRLRDAGNYLAFEKMVNALRGVAAFRNADFAVEGSLLEKYQRINELVEEHYRLGNEIKRHDEKHNGRFSVFSQEVNGLMERRLLNRQMWDAFFLASMKKAGNFSVPGSGKTSTVLGAFAFLKSRQIVEKMIVVCPNNAFDSWTSEWQACFGQIMPLHCFSTQDRMFKQASRVEKKRLLRVASPGINLYLVNYEITPTLCGELTELASNGSLLVFDEVHRIKKVDGKWASACLNIAQGSAVTFALTGTPLPNTYEDLYNFLNILYPRDYDMFFGYDRSELRNADRGTQLQINERIQPFYCRTTKDDLGVPRPNDDALLSVEADSDTNALLGMLVGRYRNNQLALMIRILQLESDPMMLLEDLDLATYRWLLEEDELSGTVDVVDYSQEIIESIHAASHRAVAKRLKCVSFVEEAVLEGKSIIVWCVLKRSMRLIERDLNERGIRCAVVDGSVDVAERSKLLSDFKSEVCKVLITNPHTLAESVSLHSVCHDALYFEYSYNLVHLLQSKDRIHRLGLKEGQYTSYQFLSQCYVYQGEEYSMDERIFRRLKEKERTMMSAIESDLIEIQPTSEEDLRIIFEGLF